MSTAPRHDVIQQALAEDGLDDVTLSLFAELPSTNQWLKEQSVEIADAGQPRPWLCAADWQTRGSGRRGKQWDSEPGNITFTLMTAVPSSPAELMGLSLVTGVAVAETLKSIIDLDLQLKWPNDVLCRGGKLGGLLTEVLNGADNECVVYTGIGLNVLHHPAHEQLGIGATSLQALGMHDVDRDRMIGTIAARVLNAHEQFHRVGWSDFEERWKRHDYLRGREVTLQRSDRIDTARALGVNEQGALIVTASGKTFPVYSGEVSVRPT